MVVLRKSLHIHSGNSAALHSPAAALKTTLCDGKRGIRNNQVGVYLHKHAKTCTLWTGAGRIIEREHSWGELTDAYTVLRAGIAHGESDILTVDDIDDNKAVGKTCSGLNRVGKTGTDIRADNKTVHNDFDIVLFILLRLDVLGEFVHYTVHTDTDKTAFLCALKLLLMLTLAATDYRGKNLNSGLFRQFQHAVDYLVDSLLVDLSAADRTVGHTDTGIEKTEIVVNLGDCADGRTGILGGGLLVDGDGRGKTLDFIHIGLFHLTEEHSCIGGQ